MGAVWSRFVACLRRTDRLLLLSAALLGVAVLGFAVNAIDPVVPWVLVWAPSVAGGPVLVISCWRTSRAGHLPGPTRRFWRHIALAAGFVSVGCLFQAIDVLTTADLAGPHIDPGMQTAEGVALLLMMYALYRLPFGKQTRGELLRVLLDAGTVMLACAVFMWHFQARAAIDSGDRVNLYIGLALTLVALVVVFGVAKFLLTRHTFLDGTALRLVGLGVLIGAIGPMLRPYLESVDPHLFPEILGEPATFFFGIWAAERQRAASYGQRRGTGRVPNRSFSLLPYAAVAAVDGLLVEVVWSGSRFDERVVVGSAVLLTAIVVLRQITAFRDNGRLLRRLDHGATHDGLTGLPNRVLFQERLNRVLTAPGDRPVSVALIDLDDFKEVNDTLGHEVGDLLLIAVAHRLAGCVRAEDTVARLGGDEFVAVLDDADPEAADLAVERMIEALREPVIADGHELPIRASIGLADGRTGDESSLLLRRADIAMYAAKNIAGTVSLHYHEGMTSTADHAHLGAELREAIVSDQLFLLYQPIVDLDDGRVLGAEALVRWDHPTRGPLAPDTFIPVAERTGLIVPLGRWVLRTALGQLAAWVTEHGPAAPEVLNINISARDLHDSGYSQMVTDLLAEYGIPAGRITLEVTESMTLEPGESFRNLQRLRDLGVRVSLDDFGTGHSTLTLLHDVPVDEIKLDRSFTQATPDGSVSVAVAVIHLARALGLHVVAEGVETPEQVAQLLELGYRAAQGYYFARPMAAEKFGVLLDRGVPLTPAAA
jgi:diguanylate cyclase (GGDEF)-like protein